MGSSESTQQNVPQSAYEKAQKHHNVPKSDDRGTIHYSNLNAETTYNKTKPNNIDSKTLSNFRHSSNGKYSGSTLKSTEQNIPQSPYENAQSHRNVPNCGDHKLTHYPNLNAEATYYKMKPNNIDSKTLSNFRHSSKEFKSYPKEEPLKQTNCRQNEQFNNSSLFHQRNPYEFASCPKEEPVKKVNYNQKEEVNNINKFNQKTPTTPVKEASLSEYLYKPPSEISNLKDFVNNWNIWKEQMQSFLMLLDTDKKDYHKWGNLLLNRMGSISHEILQYLIFNKEEDKNNYSILIDKFNAYHKFITNSKYANESIVDYIERLKADSAKDMKNVDNMVKEHLEKEIEKLCKERFIAIACSKIPDFKFEKTFKSLTMAEIAFLWDICNKSSWKETEACKYCGKLHPKDKCFAFGKECNKCKRRNHFSKYCPGVMYVTNCSFCGGDHGIKKCLAYGEKCSKCNKINHFSWMCSKLPLLRNCKFCGLDHVMDRSKCPALKSFCSNCRTTGHYDIKCPKN